MEEARPTMNAPQGRSVSDTEVATALQAVLGSELLAGSPRLKEFLKYVVHEQREGRGDQIRGKTIASDVYQRPSSTDFGSDNIVRVEARRLRRLLDEYYQGPGASDPLRIHIDLGGYVPRFERREAPADASAASGDPSTVRRRTALIAGALISAGALVIAVIVILPSDQAVPPASTTVDTRAVERQAILQKSPAALQAVNLAEQARGLIYPIFDATRQKLATDMFRQAIAKDEHSSDAYAGAGQTLATLALLAIEGPDHDANLAEAKEMVARAMELAPADAWTQSSAGWVAFVDRDFDTAVRYSERALQLAPDDGNVLDFYGVVALFSGHLEKAAAASDPNRRRTGSNTRFANRNIFGAANFYLGHYDVSARSFEKANESGDPLSAPGLAYLAAAYHGMGEYEKGRQTVNRLMEAWPDFSLDRVYYRLHRDKSSAASVVDRLRELGWAMSSSDDG